MARWPVSARSARGLARASSAPIVRSRRATRMPIVKPATTSIIEPTKMKKNTEVAAASTTRNSTMQTMNTSIDRP